jgi:Zn-finger nucleic acid-binding protein
MPRSLSCPRCHQQLEKTTTPHGVFFGCPSCGGKALGVDVLRRTFAREEINAVWRRAVSSEGTAGPACPSCRNAMIEVSATADEHPLRIDVCRLCHFLWFDADELARFTPLPPKPEPAEQELPPEARQALAIAQVQLMAEQAERQEKMERSADAVELLAYILSSGGDVKPTAPRHLSTFWLVIGAAIFAAFVAVLLRLL